MLDYSRLDNECSCLEVTNFNEGPGSYSTNKCKLDKFNEQGDCIGCPYCKLDVGTFQSQVMEYLSKIGY